MTKPLAAIFDRDGTTFSVAHHRDVNGEITDWKSFNGLSAFDRPVPEVVDMMRDAKAAGLVIIMASGREDTMRPDFMHAIRKWSVPVDYLFMRRGGDRRPDDVVKTEMYHQLIEPNWKISFVVDDRPSVIQAWRDLGLRVFPVVDPGIAPF